MKTFAEVVAAVREAHRRVAKGCLGESKPVREGASTRFETEPCPCADCLAARNRSIPHWDNVT